MSVADACCAVIRACLAQFTANQLGMLCSTDVEFLHQMRVALRRLRSAIGLFRSAIPEHAWAALITDLRWLARSLGPARDWDVLTTERLPDMKKHFKDEPGMMQLEEKCMEGRLRASLRARRAVRSARCQCFLLGFEKSIEGRAWSAALTALERETIRQSIVPYAAATLEQRYQLVRKRGRNIGRLNETELHRLRIAVKKLRYAAEFFGALFDGARFGEFRSAATGLQDVLGRINDATAASTMLAGINEPPQRALTIACALLAGWNRHEAHRLKSGLTQIWETFRAAPAFWRESEVTAFGSVRPM
jgi:CHAD domain-containing protein